MSRPKNPKPIGLRLCEYINGSSLTFRAHQATVLILTFLAYAGFHATRKPVSIVKSLLDPGTSGPERGWAPFNGPDGTAMLGVLDVAFLGVYSIGMFMAGHLGDRVDVRVLLGVGMVGTGLFTSLFGVGYWLQIHGFWYYLAVQMVGGLFQSTGWPCVVAVVGNWFGNKRRGLITGIWNSHTSIGSIAGSVIASALLQCGWGWSFAVPGVLMAILGFLVLGFLPVSPEVVGIGRDGGDETSSTSTQCEKNDVEEPFLGGGEVEEEEAVGFVEAWRIPGVASFAMCLFFSKLVAYSFLCWLPFYISHTAIDGDNVHLSDSAAGILSSLFDVGGVIGGILAGCISDRLGARGTTAMAFIYCAIPSLLLYRAYGSVSLFFNITLMLITGVFVNGPYALITTAVSMDLGAHPCLSRNSRALATVTAIINGTGSVGAAIGPLMTGYVSAQSWGMVFLMLVAAELVAGLLLTRLAVSEVAEKMRVELQ